jgi:hypothetical protein
MELPEFLRKLRGDLLRLAEYGYADPKAQAKHEGLIKLHHQLISTLRLSLDNKEPYPMVIALDIVQNITEESSELEALLRAKT